MKSKPMHWKWTELLQAMGAETPGSGVSADMLGKVLTRAALAHPAPASRSEISKGSMLVRPAVLASGTVGKAVDALLAQDLLTELEKSQGQAGPPSRPLAVGSPRWATVGIHVDNQHEGPDKLTGIICGLNRQPLVPEPVEIKVDKEDDRHSLRGLAEAVRDLTNILLDQVADLAGISAPPELLGVGVELGGHVHRGKVIDSTHACWDHQVDLGEALTKQLSEDPRLNAVPVIVENDVNALAIRGYFEGSLSPFDSVLVAVFPRGVGGALILNGRLHRGKSGMAPEPGHLAVEYPKNPAAKRDDDSSPQPAPGPMTFKDECSCSTKSSKKYGHVDTLATPSRIEGELASLRPDEQITLEKAAASPRAIFRDDQDQLVVSEEAKILHRAGRALGRGLTHIINIINPGQLVLWLPESLATPAPQSSGTEYLEAAEREIDNAYSTAATDARGGEDEFRLQVIGYADDRIGYDGAVAAAATVFNAFIEHARGFDGCPPPDRKKPRSKPVPAHV